MARFGDFDQYLQDDGNPLVSGKLYFFETGTTTAKTTYSDINNSIPNTHPVILTASGRQPNVFFDGVAKAILATSADVQIAVQDPVGETSTDFGDEWVPTKIYTAKDVVIGSDGIFYRSLVNGNQNNNPVNTSGSWTLLYSVEWNAGITYAAGALVTLNNFQYQSLQSTNLNQNPSTQTAYWVPLNFAWTATAVYATGQNAVGTDGVLYTSLQNSNTGNVPASSAAYWVGTSAASAASATASANSATASAASETAAATSATSSATSATASASSATASANSATASAGSATAAENFSNAVEWVSGTTYAVGIVAWSPINYLPYRRIIAGAGTTDPSADSTNWTALAAEVTLGTLTKTFTTGEVSTMTLSSAVTAGAPVVSVSKEIPQTGVSNGNWDVDSTAENYTRLDSAPATTLAWVGFDVSTSVYSKNFSVASQEIYPQDLAFNTDGTKMFVLGQDGDDVNEYALSTGFDVSTASFTDAFSVAAQEIGPRGLAFSTDGTKMFVVGYAGTDVNEYTLTTGFDVSSASFTDSFSVASQESQPTGLAFSTDGTKMFVTGYNNSDNVNEYALSTGFDVSTASFTDAFSVAAQDTSPRGLKFNADGTKMFVAGATGVDINEYSLTTGFDVSTASFTQSFDVSAQATQPYGVAFNADGTKMFVVDSSADTVSEYVLGRQLALGTGSFASGDVGKTIEANSGAFVLTTTSGAYVETTAPTSYAQAASGSWEMYGVVYNATDGDLELSSITIGFDVSTAAYSQDFSVTTQEIDPLGLAFNVDGTKMFVCGGTGDEVNEYALSTAFDVSTSVAVSVFSVAAQDTYPTAIEFNTDGTKMFILGNSGQDVNEYALATGFDVTTASFTGSFSVSAQEVTPQGLAFNTDGTKMFVLGSVNGANEYALSTGFVVASAVFTDAFSVAAQALTAQAIAFSSDGTKMLIVDSNLGQVNEYALSTGFDVSTASFTDAFSVAAQDQTPTGLSFNTDGTKMFVIGNANDKVYEYSMGSFTAPSGYNPVHTTSSIDSTYWTDINSMTADQAAGSGTINYCISTDDRTTWGIVDNTSGERDIVRNNAGTWQYNSNGTYASETWVAGATNTELATIAEAMEGAAAGPNLSAAAYIQSFSVASQENNPCALAFNATGSKMYVLGISSRDVHEYSLSTNFNVSTAVHTQDFNVSSQDNAPRGLAFSTDGTKMFVTGASAPQKVSEYSLSSGFNVSTASFVDSLNISGQETNPQGLAFSNNGEKMFVVGYTGLDINEYSLTTGFDVSTASFVDSFSVSAQVTGPSGVTFNTDGLEMYVVDTVTDSVYKYTLSSSFDVSTASYTQTLSVAAQDTVPKDIAFNSNNAKMFIVGASNDSVYEYSVATFTNQMDKTQLDAVTDANHIVLGNDLDLAIVFNLSSGTTVPSSDGVAINYDANVLNELAVVGADYDADFPATDKVRITALSGANLKVRVV